MQYDIFLGTKLVQIVFDITLTRKFWRFSILNRKTIFSLQRKCLISWPPRDRRAAFEHLYHAIDKATTDQTGSESWGLSVIVASNLDSWGGEGEVPLSLQGNIGLCREMPLILIDLLGHSWKGRYFETGWTLLSLKNTREWNRGTSANKEFEFNERGWACPILTVSSFKWKYA